MSKHKIRLENDFFFCIFFVLYMYVNWILVEPNLNTTIDQPLLVPTRVSSQLTFVILVLRKTSSSSLIVFKPLFLPF